MLHEVFKSVFIGYCTPKRLLSQTNLRAESEGFEPPVQLPVHRISSAARSTTLAAFLRSSFATTNVGKI